MISRVFSAYILGLVVALAMVKVSQASGENNETDSDSGGTNVNVVSDFDDSLKADTFVDVLKNFGGTVISVSQSLFGSRDPDKDCCMDGETKRDNGATWDDSEGNPCECNKGVISCTINDIVVPVNSTK